MQNYNRRYLDKMPCCPRKKHPAAIEALEPKDHAKAKVPS